MSSFAIALVVVSSFMHASWNLLARQKRSEAVFFKRMLVGTVAIGFLPATISEVLARSIAPRAWLYVLGSGLCCGFYFTFLARAYRSSDFTIVYPVARSLPVLFLAVSDVLRGRPLRPIGWVGVLLVVCGCALSPLQHFRDFAVDRYLNRANLWTLLTAVGMFGYSLLDKAAAEYVDPGPATAARYGYFFFLIALSSYILFQLVFKAEDQKPDDVGWGFPIISSVLNFGSYWLVLWAYQLSQHASYVVAFRQTSIVIGVGLAFLIYRESGVAIRLSGSLLITIGLILIALWGG